MPTFRRSGLCNFNELYHFTMLKLRHRCTRSTLNMENTDSVYDKIQTFTSVNGVEVDNTPTREEWDAAMNEYVTDLARELRNRKLKDTDRYALPDFPHVSEEKRQEWVAYRSTLRNYMDTFTFDVPEHGCIDDSDIIFPEPPSP
jgi:hypothetical protein